MKKFMVIASSALMMNLFMESCTDLGDDADCPVDLTGELTEIETELVGTWELTNMVSEDEVDLTDDDVENPSTQIYQQLSACQKDVVTIFENNRTSTVELGFMASNCNNKESIEGTWKLAGNELTIIALCSTQDIDITFNEDKTIFTRVDNYTFKDIYGFIINTDVTSTYEKTL